MMMTPPRTNWFIASFLIFVSVVSTSFVKSRYNVKHVDSDTVSIAKQSTLEQVKPMWQTLYQRMGLQAAGLSAEAFRYAYSGFEKAGFKKEILAIADFSQSSRQKRFYIVDLKDEKLLYRTYVAHGRNSGLEYARNFSNTEASYQSSLGFYRTLGTYHGKHGLSLHLQGLEPGINHRAAERAIVMHGADYVSEQFIRQTGRLGRSQGCPAVSVKDAPKLISMLQGGAGLFLYYPDPEYIKSSKFLI